MSLKTCAPLTSGNISLVKSQPIQIVSTSQPEIKNTTSTNSLHTIGDEDKIGQALINELSKRKYYALIIGINDYTDVNIQTLDNPVKDAQSLAQVLKTYYSFEKEDVLVLSNPNRAEIIDAMDALSTKVTDRDNLLIFYAGHGIWNEQLNQGYWLPSNAALSSKADWLSNSTIRDYLRGINSKHTLLISDACFSGGILKERAVFENSRAILEVYRLPSRKAMTSGTLKTVPDQSVFIEYLLKNLIQNKSPLMSADQLFRQFKTAVINNSPNGQVPQYGPISQAGDEGGDFVFLRKE
nr:caspase family protein [Marivirga atlantica]